MNGSTHGLTWKNAMASIALVTVRGGKKHVWLETPPLWEKIHRAVTLDPAHISSLDGCIP